MQQQEAVKEKAATSSSEQEAEELMEIVERTTALLESQQETIRFLWDQNKKLKRQLEAEAKKPGRDKRRKGDDSEGDTEELKIRLPPLKERKRPVQRPSRGWAWVALPG